MRKVGLVNLEVPIKPEPSPQKKIFKEIWRLVSLIGASDREEKWLDEMGASIWVQVAKHSSAGFLLCSKPPWPRPGLSAASPALPPRPEGAETHDPSPDWPRETTNRELGEAGLEREGRRDPG